ncbi:hypothetical protein PENTCL1PPCAC_16511, partial [Pristionchus entomophagus]
AQSRNPYKSTGDLRSSQQLFLHSRCIARSHDGSRSQGLFLSACLHYPNGSCDTIQVHRIRHRYIHRGISRAFRAFKRPRFNIATRRILWTSSERDLNMSCYFRCSSCSQLLFTQSK